MRLRKPILPLIFCTFLALPLHSQSDLIGSGRAISFDGVNDYIDFGDIYSDLALPFTVSAWVYLDPSNNQFGPIFSNRNCDPVYTGFRLMINSTLISLEYGDGIGGNNPAFRRGKQANVDLLNGSWNHITAVVRGVSDMDLYLNGINVGGTFTGASNLTMDSSKPGFATSAYFISNGVVYRFKGTIDDIRLWNRPLSEDEIRKTMCINLIGNESGLIGYWDFNETNGSLVFDKSLNHFTGVFVKSPKRVFSGAPIGDVSTYHYASSWTGKTVSLQDGDHKIDVKNVSGNDTGVQIYEIKNSPSQISGLDINQVNKPYFGVFMAKQNTSSSFDAEYTFQSIAPCESYSREDNSKSPWIDSDMPALSRVKRFETINITGATVAVDLGVDRVLCDQNSYEISTGITDPQFTFQWNNAKTTSSVTINQSGRYSVEVFGGCGVIKDSVTISFLQTPEAISLGNDTQACDFKPITFQPITDPTSHTFLWQDGSTSPIYTAKNFGKYWVSVKNLCGEVSDTVVFSKINYSDGLIPNVITPNYDGKNDYFIVDERLVGLVSLKVVSRWGQELHYSKAYDNKWDGGGLSTGIYFIFLEGECIGRNKGILHILH